MEYPGFIYIILLRECLKSGESVFKIGCTKDIVQRYLDYPKGSRLVFTMFVQKCRETEVKVLEACRQEFIQRKDYGREYFEGSAKAVIKAVIDTIGFHNDVFTVALEPENNDDNQVTSKPPPIDRTVLIERFVDAHKQEFHNATMKSSEVYNKFMSWIMQNRESMGVTYTLSHKRVTSGLKEQYGVESKPTRFEDGVSHALKFGNLIDEVCPEDQRVQERLLGFIEKYIEVKPGSFVRLKNIKTVFVGTPFYNGQGGMFQLLKDKITEITGQPCIEQKKIKGRNESNVYMGIDLKAE